METPSAPPPAFDAPLDRAFYARSVDDVAHDLLGCYLVRRKRGRILGGRIVEVEAYGGPGDPGSHADRAPNGRARIMFGNPGIAYVYFTYGMHHCMNAVTGEEGDASAVLIRAIEPLWNVEAMRRGAPAKLADHLVGSGPGRVCRALDVDRTLNGTDLVEGTVRILPRGKGDPRTTGDVRSSVRVGLSKDDHRTWRFFTGSRSVSRNPRPGRRS